MIILLNHNIPEIASQILKLQRESYQVEANLIDYQNIPYMKQGIEQIQNTNESFIGYKIKNLLTGVISYEKRNHRNVTICRLIIKPDYFRKGIAEKLVVYIEEIEKKIQSIYVETAKKNLPAINLYYKLGYHTIRKFKTPDGLTIVGLIKVLE